MHQKQPPAKTAASRIGFKGRVSVCDNRCIIALSIGLVIAQGANQAHMRPETVPQEWIEFVTGESFGSSRLTMVDLTQNDRLISTNLTGDDVLQNQNTIFCFLYRSV